MDHQFFFAAASAPGPLESIKQQFGFNTQLFISQVISFCVIAFLLHRFAYKPVLGILEERRKRIAEGLANADKMKLELANAQSKAQEILGQAGAQANKIIEEARTAAAKVQEQETQKAIAMAEQIMTKAREAAAADHTRMLAELKREVVRLVVQTTTTVTGKVLTTDDQKRLSEEAAKQLAK